jgi:hypothetical protein
VDLSFLATGWLYAAPAFVTALVLLYFLKLKRRVVVTSSTFLWHQALNDLRVNSPFQRLRMNVLLFLQLFALILLLFALARPVSNIGGLKGTDSILLLDVSASMQTRDEGGETRLELAVEQAKRVVDDLSRNDRAIVLAFSDEVRVLTDMTDSKSLLHRSLDELEATERPTRLAPAIHRVRALLGRSERSPELFVFSDGRVGPLEGAALEEAVPLHYVAVGSAAENLGIVSMDVSIASGLGDDTRIFASVQNSGSEQRTVGVDLYIDDELVDSRELTLNAGGVGSAPFDAPIFDDATRQRRVKVALDHEEAFAVDDVGYALVGERDQVGVLLVTGGNLFLHSALNEDPLIRKTPRGDVPLLAPDQFDPDDPALADYDVIVLDRFTPERLPSGNYLCFGARPPFEGFEDKGQVENSKVLDWDETHETTRFVNFATLMLPTARRFQLAERYDVVVRGTGGPIVIDARDRDRRAVVCSFDLLAFPVEGAWTFDPSFPIFLANTIRSLGGADGKREGGLVRAGSTGELYFPPNAKLATVTPPAGEPYDVPILPGDEVLYLTDLGRCGIYSVTFKDETGKEVKGTRFAVNLVDSDESVIAPAPKLVLEGRPEAEAEDEALESNKDVWKLVAAAALLFVLVEWWVYNRRVFL